MKKIKIKKIGHLPIKFDDKKILNCKSKLFEIIGDIESFTLPTNSDGPNWEFTDENLRKVIFADSDVDFTIAITNVKLENNYYLRIINKNLIVLTFYEIKEILEKANIPLENIVLRIIYATSLACLDKVSPMEIMNHTHDETKGCLYDMTGIKEEIIYSCNKPIICSECITKFKQNGVSVNALSIAQNGIKRIKKELFYSLIDSFKSRPILSFIIIIVLSTIISESTIYLIKYLINSI